MVEARRRPRWRWVAATLATSVAVLAHPAGAQLDRSADLDALGAWIEAEQSWPAGAAALAQQRLVALRPAAGALSDPEFLLAVAEIVALADNGHSNVSFGPAVQRWGLLPIRLFPLDDGLRVVRATREHADLLGARPAAIEGRPTDEVVSALLRYHGGTEEMFRAYFANALLLSPTLLHAAGLASDPRGVEVTFERADGATETRRLSVWNEGGEQPVASPWLYVAAGELRGEGGAWVGVREQIELPWAMQAPTEWFRYRFLADLGVAHVQFRSNFDVGEQRIEDWVDEFEDRLERDRPRHVILDDRDNGGGDLNRAADFALDLHDFLPDEGRVFSLTSGRTFSAGIYTAHFPEASDSARTVVVGTRVGDRDRFWAESDGRRVLEGIGISIGTSLQAHDPTSGCSADECHLRRRGRRNIAVGPLEPEVEVPTTWEDLRSGRDPQVEWVLETLRGTRG